MFKNNLQRDIQSCVTVFQNSIVVPVRKRLPLTIACCVQNPWVKWQQPCPLALPQQLQHGVTEVLRIAPRRGVRIWAYLLQILPPSDVKALSNDKEDMCRVKAAGLTLTRKWSIMPLPVRLSMNSKVVTLRADMYTWKHAKEPTDPRSTAIVA